MNGKLVQALKEHSRGFQLEPAMVLMGYVGSLAHGTHVPNTNPNSIDDRDVMGIFVAPKGFYIGLEHGSNKDEGRQFWEGEWDITTYELQKFVWMLLNCNPNVLSLLWLEQNDYLKVTPAGQLLIDNRDAFVSKKAYKAFSGYADGQLKRMTRIGGDSKSGFLGAKRKGLVEKFGYDTKNAAHLIRIQRMGIEFLTEGKLYVKRQDSSELIQIKNGEYKVEKIQEMAEEQFKLAQLAYVNSKLPIEPDWERANKLTIQIVEMVHGEMKRTGGVAREEARSSTEPQEG